MKPMTLIVSTLIFVLFACSDSAPAPISNKTTASEIVASNNSVTTDQTDAISPRYKNGTNDQNKGDKTGIVKLHGNIAAASGSMMYLYETEARNIALLDSAKVVGGIFNFNNLEIGRGIYELVLNGKANNKTQIILNPDESDVDIDFKSSRLTGNKTAPSSIENTAWFKYITLENRNKNEIKNLRKGMKDSPYRSRIEEQIKGKELELVQTQHEMMDTYAGTYFAKLI